MKLRRDDPLAKVAAGMGAGLYDLLSRGGHALGRAGEKVIDSLHSGPVRRAGEAIGEAGGRLMGAMEGMATNRGGGLADAVQRASMLESRANQGAELGWQYAPTVAGGLGALGLGYLGKRLLLDRGGEDEENRPIYPEQYNYPNYTY